MRKKTIKFLASTQKKGFCFEKRHEVKPTITGGLFIALLFLFLSYRFAWI